MSVALSPPLSATLDSVTETAAPTAELTNTISPPPGFSASTTAPEFTFIPATAAITSRPVRPPPGFPALTPAPNPTAQDATPAQTLHTLLHVISNLQIRTTILEMEISIVKMLFEEQSRQIQWCISTQSSQEEANFKLAQMYARVEHKNSKIIRCLWDQTGQLHLSACAQEETFIKVTQLEERIDTLRGLKEPVMKEEPKRESRTSGCFSSLWKCAWKR